MADRTFDRETLLSITINIIPLGIILFFIVLFLGFDPFENDIGAVFYMMLLLVVPFLSLALVTYVAGRIIAEAQHTGESETAATITRFIAGEVSTGESEENE